MSAQKNKKCINGCCFSTEKHPSSTLVPRDFRHKFKTSKAGIFFYDPSSTRVLLVQSHGIKWGFPKGSMNDGETILECAIREVQEETGITIDPTQLSTSMQHKIDRATYYFLEYPSTHPTCIPSVEDNDATGIGWMRTECIEDMHAKGAIDLNSHCKKLLSKILKLNLKKL